VQSFVFEGLPPPGLPQNWLTDTTRAAPGSAITLGPDPNRPLISGETKPN